jgi:hypothetical protein
MTIHDIFASNVESAGRAVALHHTYDEVLEMYNNLTSFILSDVAVEYPQEEILWCEHIRAIKYALDLLTPVI